eukprot:GHVN01006313.1.p1 GENE.GHVN01006313.1~~GHVN01006313.1.p1  ORF type:complete len:441 (+),score=91.18 GHVN01006313.1:1624-2946(+)
MAGEVRRDRRVEGGGVRGEMGGGGAAGSKDGVGARGTFSQQVEFVDSKWKVEKKIGSGSFGEIYRGVDVLSENRTECAIKVESRKAKHPQLEYEYRLLKHLQGAPGIAKVYSYSTMTDYCAMVIELLGPSLEDVFTANGRRFPMRTILLIADQIIHRVEYLHSKNFIHRDIKPDNFLIGPPGNTSTIYMIDLGLAKRYRDTRTHEHIQKQENKNLTGTARYASINAHKGTEQSRRDDLEAVGYLLLYFCRAGLLPWQGVKANTKQEKYNKIREKKEATSVESLCKGFPMAFTEYLTYCRALAFEDRPDYDYLRRLFRDHLASEGIDPEGEVDIWASVPITRIAAPRTSPRRQPPTGGGEVGDKVERGDPPHRHTHAREGEAGEEGYLLETQGEHNNHGAEEGNQRHGDSASRNGAPQTRTQKKRFARCLPFCMTDQTDAN